MNHTQTRNTPQLPPGYTISHTHSYPEGLRKAYIAPPTGEVLAITGDGDNLTVELSDSHRTNAWTELHISPRYASHDDAVVWWITAIAAGEAREQVEGVAA